MTPLAGVLGVLLLIAVIYIVVDRIMAWLVKNGGITIRIESDDDSE